MSRRRSLLGVAYVGGLKEESTAFVGVGLLVELYRQVGVGTAAERALPRKRSPKGLKQEQMVESFVLLSALGGECLEDMERLRQDRGLVLPWKDWSTLPQPQRRPGPSAEGLDRFHEEGLMARRPAQGSFLPAESPGLAGLREVNRRPIQAYVRAVKPVQEVTLAG